MLSTLITVVKQALHNLLILCFVNDAHDAHVNDAMLYVKVNVVSFKILAFHVHLKEMHKKVSTLIIICHSLQLVFPYMLLPLFKDLALFCRTVDA